MDSQNHREYDKKNYLKNGTKSQGQYTKNSYNTTSEKPGTNESGLEAKHKGF